MILKNILPILFVILTTAVTAQNYNVGICYDLHIKSFIIEPDDGFRITMDGKQGNEFAAKRNNAYKIADELISRYKKQGGSKYIYRTNLACEILFHAYLYNKGILRENTKETNADWEDITKKYSIAVISKRLYKKYKVLSEKVIEKIIK